MLINLICDDSTDEVVNTYITYTTNPLVLWLETLTAQPEVVGSILTQDKYLCDKHEYLFCVWM